MAIILSEEEKIYLKTLLNKQPDWWIRNKILSSLADEEAVREVQRNCPHLYAPYIREYTACQKCNHIDSDKGIYDTRKDFYKENPPANSNNNQEG